MQDDVRAMAQVAGTAMGLQAWREQRDTVIRTMIDYYTDERGLDPRGLAQALNIDENRFDALRRGTILLDDSEADRIAAEFHDYMTAEQDEAAEARHYGRPTPRNVYDALNERLGKG